MKGFFWFILTIFLCAVLVGGVYARTQTPSDVSSDTQMNSSVLEDSENKTPSTDTSDVPTGDSAGENTSDAETPNEDTLKGLKIPSNESKLIADGMKMQVGAQLALTEERALRFTCDITTELYNEVKADSNKSFGMLVIAQNYFDRVNTEGYTYIDWITAFQKAGVTTYNYYEFELDTLPSDSNGYYMKYKLYDIPYSGINHSIVCIGVLATKTASGEVTYQYAEMPRGETYQSNARSIAYVAAASLNAHALGIETFTEEKLALLRSYVNESVDKANGLTEATDDGSMYAFTTNITTAQTLSVGEDLTIITTISPDVNVPVWYRSSDESIVEIDGNGKVTAKAKGTAVIGVYVAGETYGITIKVS